MTAAGSLNSSREVPGHSGWGRFLAGGGSCLGISDGHHSLSPQGQKHPAVFKISETPAAGLPPRGTSLSRLHGFPGKVKPEGCVLDLDCRHLCLSPFRYERTKIRNFLFVSQTSIRPQKNCQSHYCCYDVGPTMLLEQQGAWL